MQIFTLVNLKFEINSVHIVHYLKANQSNVPEYNSWEWWKICVKEIKVNSQALKLQLRYFFCSYFAKVCLQGASINILWTSLLTVLDIILIIIFDCYSFCCVDSWTLCVYCGQFMGTYGFAEGECLNLFGRFVFSKICVIKFLV